MAWSAPRTWVAGETLTAALLNAELRDNLNAAAPVGSIHYYIRAATTAETLINAFALEGNGVQVLRATYGALNTLLSSLGYPFGSGNGSTTLTLPDIQSRMLVAMGNGAHADTNALGDSDGLAKTTRTPLHGTSSSLGLSGAPSIGTLAITPNPHSHTISGLYSGGGGNPSSPSAQGASQVSTDGTSLALSGAPGVGSLAVGGTVGASGTRPQDVVPYLVAGVYAVKI